MNRFALTSFAIAAVAGAPLALAQQVASTPVTGSPAASSPAVSVALPRPSETDELGVLDREVQLWKKRAEVAKYKADVKAAEARDLGGLSTPLPRLPMSGASPDGVTPMSGSPVAVAVSSRPHLVRVGGADGHFDALIDVGGHTVDVTAGDTLDEGWTVASITASSVRLVRGKQTLLLKA